MYKVIITAQLSDPPSRHELAAAFVLAYHFHSDVIFLRPQIDKTPDVEVLGVRWEIKSPKGNSKKTIENNLRTARKQSENIVIDLSRSKMTSARAIARISFYLRMSTTSIKRVKVITKTKQVIDVR